MMNKKFLPLLVSGFIFYAHAHENVPEHFLNLTNLSHFSENLLRNERQNLEQFSQEINHLQCLSHTGKTEARAVIAVLEVEMSENASSLKTSIQDSLKEYLNSILSHQDIQAVVDFMDTTHGKNLLALLKEKQQDIINDGILVREFYTIAKNHQEQNKNNHAFKVLERLSTPPIKNQILSKIVKNDTLKTLQQGIEKLQRIFMQEGCGID